MSEDAFRDELRAWLAAHPPPGHGDLDPARQRAWQRTLFDGGWAGVAWPTAFGGRGATPRQQLIFHEELGQAGGNDHNLFFVGVSHAGPTLISHGTEEQRRRYLPGILQGDLVFCQCFSEPGAGSDLAAVATRAVVDGDHLVVSGEKRWSTYAQYADHCEMLVRTGEPGRAGLTFVIGDMRAAGVDVRPIAAMDGEAEFSEVFFDEARIPLADVVGGLGDGWKVAMTTLLFERSTAFAGTVMAASRGVAALAALVAGDAALEDRVAGLAARAAAVQALLYRTVADAEAGQPSEAGSAIKLASSELNHDVARLAAELDHDALRPYLRSFGLRIGGGTSEIQRNIIGERVLGLPR